MGINYFTDEQLKELNNNPYVVKCSAKNITYAEEFKDLFWIDYQNGMPPIKYLKNTDLIPMH